MYRTRVYKVRGCDERLSAQNAGDALYGLQRMSIGDPQVLKLVTNITIITIIAIIPDGRVSMYIVSIIHILHLNLPQLASLRTHILILPKSC